MYSCTAMIICWYVQCHVYHWSHADVYVHACAGLYTGVGEPIHVANYIAKWVNSSIQCNPNADHNSRLSIRLFQNYTHPLYYPHCVIHIVLSTTYKVFYFLFSKPKINDTL